MSYTSCPLCSAPTPSDVLGVHTCRHCGAVYGECYRGESYRFVLPSLSDGQTPAEDWRYYDFRVIGSDGVERRHGWFDPATKLITQIG